MHQNYSQWNSKLNWSICNSKTNSDIHQSQIQQIIKTHKKTHKKKKNQIQIYLQNSKQQYLAERKLERVRVSLKPKRNESSSRSMEIFEFQRM